jgi:hypothetical protein
VAKKLPPSKVYSHRWEVESNTSNRLYVVSIKKEDGSFGCSCPAWKFQRKECDHLRQVRDEVYPREQLRELSDATRLLFKALAECVYERSLNAFHAHFKPGSRDKQKALMAITNFIVKRNGSEIHSIVSLDPCYDFYPPAFADSSDRIDKKQRPFGIKLTRDLKSAYLVEELAIDNSGSLKIEYLNSVHHFLSNILPNYALIVDKFINDLCSEIPQKGTIKPLDELPAGWRPPLEADNIEQRVVELKEIFGKDMKMKNVLTVDTVKSNGKWQGNFFGCKIYRKIFHLSQKRFSMRNRIPEII